MSNSSIGHNRLKSFVERVERLRDEIADLNADVSDIYKEAKGEGWNVQAIKALISERARHARNPEKFRELNDFVELYRSALENGTVIATRARGTSPNPAASPLTPTRAGATPPPSPSATGDTAAPVSPTHSHPAATAAREAGSTGEGGASYALASPVNSDEPDLPAFLDRRKHV